MSELYQFPNRDIDDSEKDSSYHVSWAKAIYHLYDNDKTGISNSNRTWINLMRLYANGNQPKEFYSDAPNLQDNIQSAQTDVDGSWNQNQAKKERGGLNHINDDIVSVMPRIINKMKGALAAYSYDISVDAIDKDSGAEKEDRKWHIWAMKEHGGFIKQLRANAGIPHKEEAFLPQDTHELKIFEAVQGFKLNYEKEMQKLLKHSFEISNWHDVEESIIDDLLAFRWGIAKVYLDEEDNKFKVEYIDPYDVVIPYNKNDDYTSIPFAGHFEMMTVSDLRIRLPHLTEKDLYSLAKSFCGKYGNPARMSKNSAEVNADGSYAYDNYKVQVFHCEWIDWKNTRKMYYKSSFGRMSAYILDREDKVEPKPGKKEVSNVVVRKLRKCSWVVGSNHSYEWGLANLTDRPAKNKVVPNYIVIRLKGKSITEVLRPVMDDIQIAWRQFQDGRAMAIQSGYALDFSMLQNIEDGNQKYSMLDILEMWREYGILLFQGSLSGRYEGGAVKPIFDIPGTAGATLQEAVQLWDLAMRKIMDLTGISPVALGATPAPGESATGTHLSAQAMNDIISPIVKKVLNVKERAAGSLVRRLQLALRVREDIVSSYEPVVGKDGIEILKAAEKTHVQYGFVFRAAPTEEEKQALLQMAQISLNNRREGKPGIDSATYAYIIEQVINGGDLKEMRMVIAFQEAKARQEMAAQQERAIQTQNQGLQQLEEQKAQKEIQISQMKAQAEIAVAKEKALADILKTYYAERPEEARAFLEMTGMLQPQQPPQQGAGMQEQGAVMP